MEEEQVLLFDRDKKEEVVENGGEGEKSGESVPEKQDAES